MLRLHNTLTRRVEPIRPMQPGRVTMYSCGPTVYRPVHLGNLRSFLLADLVRRALGTVEVHQVMNITDVGHMTDEVYDRGEDKMLLAAADEGLPAGVITAVAAFGILELQRRGFRPVEAVLAGLLTPRFAGTESILLAGILVLAIHHEVAPRYNP